MSRFLMVPVMLAGLVAGAGTSSAQQPAAGSTGGDVHAVGSVDDGVPAYLSAVYGDLFGRDVDPSGDATWTTALRTGTPRRAVADAITGSDEFRTGLIINAYDIYLGRDPDPAGLQHWLAQMRAGLTIQQMEAGFLGSEEYFVAAGRDEFTWVATLYAEILGRQQGSLEGVYWLTRIYHPNDVRACSLSRSAAACFTRDQVALAFLNSTERLTADVNADYQWLLGRDLDASGATTWVGQLQHGVRYESVIGSIIASDEYWQLVTAG